METVTDIRSTLEAGVVRAIFDSVRSNGRDRSLPEIVVQNRRNHAYARVLDALVSRGAPTIPKDLRGRLESMIENWSNRSFDDGFAPIQEFEIQCARERDLVIAEASGDPQRVLDVLEADYRRKVVERFGFIELRGLQLSHRVILDLERVYIPLHFQTLVPATGDVAEQIALTSRRSIGDIIQENTRILLIGSPGSGKSTLVSFLASRCALGKHGLRLPDRVLPLVVTVRELKDAEFTPEWLADRLEIALDLVLAALAQGRALLLVDGLDEAPEGLRAQVVRGLARFTSWYPTTAVIVTSRPTGAPGAIESCLPGFQGFRLADLADSEVDEFIDKWCLTAETSARPDSTAAQQQATAAADDLKARIQRSRPVQRIAVNPLLVTILCVVHRFLGRTIPEHRVTLYEKCTDALLYEWDRAKFPEGAAVGELDANQKRVLLRGVASALHEKHEAEMPEQEVVRYFASILPQLGKPQEDALRIVREIRDRSGLLVERRPGSFAFSHLTFQEYLTALDYASRTRRLIERFGDSWWDEVVALAVGIPGCDPAEIIRALLHRKGREDIILAAKCLETAIHLPLELRKEVERAVEGILPPRDPEGAIELQEIGVTVAPILARELPNYGAVSRVHSLVFFSGFKYEPVIPTLIHLAPDSRRSAIGFGISKGHYYIPTVGEFSIFVLGNMARTSETAKRAFAAVLEKPLPERFLEALRPREILGDDFKPARAGKRSPKPAKNTA